MKNVEFQTNDHNVQNDSAFLGACREALERISDKAPSDHNVRIIVGHDGSRFKIRVRLRAADLKFSHQGSAMSPFMALDAAMDEAIGAVKKWSLSRAS